MSEVEKRMGQTNNIPYAGLWLRLKAILVDCIILLPAWFYIIFYPFKSRADAAVAAVAILFITGIVYPICFHAKWGQTIGKMILKIKVTKPDFSDIGIRHAIMRSSVDTVFAVIYSAIQVQAIYSVSKEQFQQLGALARSTLISGATPHSLSALSYTWGIGGILVILMNRKKRALRDFIGETILIKI